MDDATLRAPRTEAQARQTKRLCITLLCLAAALVAAEVALRSRVLTKPRLAGWRSAERGVKADELNDSGFRGRRFEYAGDDSVVDDPKIKSAVENVNRRAADGCELYKQNKDGGGGGI